MTRLYQWLRAEPRRTVIGVLVALVVVEVVIVLLVLRSAIAVPLAVASFTAAASVAAVVYAKSEEHKREIAQQQHAQKAAVYQDFLDYWFRYFRAPDPKLSESEREQEDEEASVTYRATVPQKLVLWASEPVIKEHNRYMRLDRTEVVTMFEFERIMLALRKDLRYSNEDLKKGGLLHLFLKGVEERLREEEQAQQEKRGEG